MNVLARHCLQTLNLDYLGGNRAGSMKEELWWASWLSADILRGRVSPHFSAAESGFRELSVIRRYRTVTCCMRVVCAILMTPHNAARLYAPVTC